MATPTREQVDLWQAQAGFSVMKFATLARADLEAAIAEKDVEISHLRMALADTEALEMGTSEKVISQQAHIKVLRDALINHQKLTRPIAKSMEALAIQSSTDALREHDAKLVERIAEETDAFYPRTSLVEIADKIRKGEWR